MSIGGRNYVLVAKRSVVAAGDGSRMEMRESPGIAQQARTATTSLQTCATIHVQGLHDAQSRVEALKRYPQYHSYEYEKWNNNNLQIYCYRKRRVCLKIDTPGMLCDE